MIGIREYEVQMRLNLWGRESRCFRKRRHVNLFVEMFMVEIISDDQRKPRPGNTSDADMTETSVLVTQHMPHMIG